MDRSIISGNVSAILVRLAMRYFLVVNVSLVAHFLHCSDLLMGPVQRMGKVHLLNFPSQATFSVTLYVACYDPGLKGNRDSSQIGHAKYKQNTKDAH